MREMPSMCIDCPHSIYGEAVVDSAEMDLLEEMARTGERHECHNNRTALCVGQRIGCFAVIAGEGSL